jgi:hypothetical protein
MDSSLFLPVCRSELMAPPCDDPPNNNLSSIRTSLISPWCDIYTCGWYFVPSPSSASIQDIQREAIWE